MQEPAYTITNDTVTVLLDGTPHIVRRESKHFRRVQEALLAKNWDALRTFVTPGIAIERWLGNGFTYQDHRIHYMGEPIDDKLNDRLLAMVDEGASPAGWLRFWARLQNNPSNRSVTQLYAFLTHQGIPIDETDGHFLAYKSVTADYMDHHTKRFNNRVGVLNEMPRNKISDDPKEACAAGFHVGALEYARTFGGGDGDKIVICKVDPADVVSVPHDHSAMKVRVCRYKVVANFTGRLPSTVVKGSDASAEVPEPEVGLEPAAKPKKTAKTKAPAKVAKAKKALKAAAKPNLDAMLLPALRTYASQIGITGASKLPGGRPTLLAAIRKALKALKRQK